MPVISLICSAFATFSVHASLPGLNLDNPLLIGLQNVNNSPARLTADFDGGKSHLIITQSTGSQKDSQALADSRALVIKAAYSPTQAPYPGTISNRIDCGERKVPERFERKDKGLWAAGYIYDSNERFAISGCRAEDKFYRTLHAVLHCATKPQTFEIKVLAKDTADSKLREIFKAFTCTDSKPPSS